MQIGSVELKRPRVYPAHPSDPESMQIMVPPGIFPLMRSGDRIWWPMRGRVSERRDTDIDRIGEGTFLVTPGGDVVSEEERSILSPTFTPDQLRSMMAHPGFRDEDGDEQRVRIVLFDPPALCDVEADAASGGEG